jgi:hypothetical protein
VNHQDVMAFKRRSSRIRCLALDMKMNATQRSIQSLTAFLLCASHADLPLFPKLRRLSLQGDGVIVKDTTHLSALLGPQVSSLSIAPNMTHGTSNASFISSLTRRCPRLSNLYMAGNLTSLHAGQIVDVVHSGTRLTTVSLTTGSKDVFNALSRLPCLVQLSLTISQTNDFKELKSTLYSAGFPVLSRLTVDCEGDLSACPPMIRCFSGVGLDNLTIYTCRAGPTHVMENLIELLPHHLDHAELTALAIRESHIGLPALRQDGTSTVLEDPFCLQALQAFTRLFSLDLQCASVPASVRMESLRALANAVPRLTRLSVYEDADAAYKPKPHIKIKDLPAILRLFPALITLAIPIDATDVEWDIKYPEGGFQSTRLETLHVGTSPINSLRDVAAYLSAVVPSLEYVFASEQVIQDSGALINNVYYDTWGEVQSLVEFLVEVREQERNWHCVSGSEEEEEEEGSDGDSDSKSE